MAPPMVAFFHLLQFLALFVREIGSDLPVRLYPDLADAAAGIASDLL
jgi:hypothetical protein